MGYYIDQVESNFFIKKENVDNAWNALVELFKIEKKSIRDSSGWHYSWISTDCVLNAKTFDDTMCEARWSVYFDTDGNVNGICFNGEKYGGDETIILGSIAPYVENGSYIMMQGEEGERWKWKFVDCEVLEVCGHWVWDDEEE